MTDDILRLQADYLSKQAVWNEAIAVHGERHPKTLRAENEMAVAWRRLTQERERSVA